MEKGAEIIKDINGNIIAVIVYDDYHKEGINFLTPADFSQQLAFLSHKSGKTIEAHVHNIAERDIRLTQETLFIKKGKLKINFYDNKKNYFESRTLCPGDTILLASGGHGFEFLEDTEIIEVKQGPYLNDNDKVRFRGIESQK